MSFVFTPAVREGVALLIGLAGGTGSGKTYSAMRLASGLSNGKPFALIDTEAKRGLHYADEFKFDHGDLRAPFRPDTYVEAIMAADKAGYPAIVVDSMSHVWAGDGGVLDWHEEVQEEMVERKRKFAASKDWKFDEYKAREAANVSAWIDPKGSHKRMVQKLLQIRAHLILCFRAEEKIEIIKNKEGKTEIVKKLGPTGLNGWMPICEKKLPFELTASFLLMADDPGIPKPIKLQRQHRALFPLDKPITEESGKLIAEWARGGAPAAAQAPDSDALTEAGTKAAKKGSEALGAWWEGLTKAEKKIMKPTLDETLKPLSLKPAAEPTDTAEHF